MGKSPLSNSNFKLQLISLLFTLFTANIYAATITGVVTRVSGGDTIQVSGVGCQGSENRDEGCGMRDEKFKVRLAKIDAPEKNQERWQGKGNGGRRDGKEIFQYFPVREYWALTRR